MNEELYVMYRAGERIYLSPVDEWKRTEGIYLIKHHGIHHKIVRRSFFYTDMNGIMFGDDKEKLIDKWNEFNKNQASCMKIRMMQYESYVVNDDDEDFIIIDRLNLNK